MVIILITWIWMLTCSYLWGYGAIKVINKILGRENDISLDYIVILGVGVLAIYAEYLSLVSGIGLLANIGLLAVDILVIVLFKNELVVRIRNVITRKNFVLYVLLIIVATWISMTYMFELVTYDTGLYHSQAIQWIEEYGVVKGLGNLHHRFAYNSALMCLQALFSMRFAFGQQLHCVSGFMLIVYMTYAIGSMKFLRYKKVFVSDFLRLAFFVYFTMDVSFSSEGSDLISLWLVIYLTIRFIEGIEEDVSEADYYVYISFLALIAISFKLSAAMIILIVIYPAYILIRDKKWSEIIKLILTGLFLTLPFLIRNVLISGYIVYPMAKLDIFNFDWEMNRYVCLWDAKEIRSWGQGVCDANLSPTFREWYEIWINRLEPANIRLFYSAIASSVVLIIASAISFIKNRDLRKSIVAVTIMAMLIYWFMGAPLMRYGVVFTVIPVLTFVGIVIVLIQNRFEKIAIVGIIAIVLFSGSRIKTLTSHAAGFRLSNDIIFNQVGFEPFEFTKAEFEGYDMYIPENGDRIGNRAFPSTPYIPNLSLIELRGDDLSYGFRVKDEYKDTSFNTYGGFIDPEIVE